jgi:hypothetical protein
MAERDQPQLERRPPGDSSAARSAETRELESRTILAVGVLGLVPVAAAIYLGLEGHLGGLYLVVGATLYGALVLGAIVWGWRHPQPLPPPASNDGAWWGEPADPDDKRIVTRGS